NSQVLVLPFLIYTALPSLSTTDFDTTDFDIADFGSGKVFTFTSDFIYWRHGLMQDHLMHRNFNPAGSGDPAYKKML
ncbi:MAG: hypothetical protein V2A34_15100, partial [Lentisphaerota bacterium]